MRSNYYGIRNTKNKLRILSNFNNIKEDYLNGKLSLEKVCIKYGVSRIGLTFILRKNGIEIRDRETAKICLRKLGLYKPTVFGGKKNPNYRHGGYCGKTKRQPEYHTAQYLHWKNDVLKRDNYLCKECNSKNSLNVHHIIPRRKDKSKFYDVSFGITLCEPCHQKTYFKEEEFIQKYLSLIQNTAKAGV